MSTTDTQLLPRYADGSGEAGWEFDWGSILVAPNDEDTPPTVTVDLDFEYEDTGLSTTMARQLAEAVQAACHAADGKPVGWTQYRAEAAPSGPTDPENPGMWKVGTGHWEGVTRLTETFDLAVVTEFQAGRVAAGQIVTVYARTFHTLTDVSPWVATPPRPEVVCSDDGIAS